MVMATLVAVAAMSEVEHLVELDEAQVEIARSLLLSASLVLKSSPHWVGLEDQSLSLDLQSLAVVPVSTMEDGARPPLRY